MMDTAAFTTWKTISKFISKVFVLALTILLKCDADDPFKYFYFFQWLILLLLIGEIFNFLKDTCNKFVWKILWYHNRQKSYWTILVQGFFIKNIVFFWNMMISLKNCRFVRENKDKMYRKTVFFRLLCVELYFSSIVI